MAVDDHPLNRSYTVITSDEDHDHGLNDSYTISGGGGGGGGDSIQDAGVDENGASPPESPPLNRSYTIPVEGGTPEDASQAVSGTPGGSETEKEVHMSTAHEPVNCGGCEDRLATHHCDECDESLCEVCCKARFVGWACFPGTDNWRSTLSCPCTHVRSQAVPWAALSPLIVLID